MHSQWFEDFRDLMGSEVAIKCFDGDVFKGKIVKYGYQFIWITSGKEGRMVNGSAIKSIKLVKRESHDIPTDVHGPF